MTAGVWRCLLAMGDRFKHQIPSVPNSVGARRCTQLQRWDTDLQGEAAAPWYQPQPFPWKSVGPAVPIGGPKAVSAEEELAPSSHSK